MLLPLKDCVIASVACGYDHTLAITIGHCVLAWGRNDSFQLGLGAGAPAVIPI